MKVKIIKVLKMDGSAAFRVFANDNYIDGFPFKPLDEKGKDSAKEEAFVLAAKIEKGEIKEIETIIYQTK